MTSSYVVSPQWLAERLDRDDIRVVDCSWYLPAMNRDAKAEYAAAHIPGAVFLDIDAIADTSVDLPHMLPSAEFFGAWAGANGIAETDTIVVYDGGGMFSSPRGWWTFRVLGAKAVYVLDGGLPAWITAGLPTTADVPAIKAKTFNAALHPARVADLDRMREIAKTGDMQIVDARPAGRFAGLDPEPRPGLRSGHMPGAHSTPSALFVAGGTLASPGDIRRIFENAGVDLAKPIVTSCGSGVTAATLSLALASIGIEETMLYDGSWAEWGRPGDTPVVLGMPSGTPKGEGPQRTLTANITELAMDAPPARREQLPLGEKVALMRATAMTPAFCSWLYEQVGRPHHWFVRRDASIESLEALIRSGEREFWVLNVGGCPAGFFELDLSALPETVEIALLGLMPQFQGRGLGRFLASEAIFAAFAHRPRQVTIETNTLDSARALILYQKLGFRPTGSRIELVDPWG